ncbi:substrate-binding domain-containing protein [Mucilaginibacter sp. HMF5004]|uniref:PstS family phosphate ABC transporter substrate-binding protein n=1 Tax=Mucilaginibacter rivuli TaxID=2857527 RepID=UPI001C5FF30E|nr:substrate-binding domain-containing protein [Mucilaginibacter rivuli]MBW4890507.1 substrate-binding domain-containing protein [Mucilaginibacter rivuli]
MKNKGFYILSFLLVLALGFGCDAPARQDKGTDGFIEGTTRFVVDESFAPIVDEEAYVFKALYNKAKPQFINTSERNALNLFLTDSIRIAILARNLRPDEQKLLKSKTLTAEINLFAYDAVTLIVNKESADTITSAGEIKKMLNGQTKTDRNIVFDNPNSSITRYLKEFSGNQTLQQKNIYALKSNVEVIKYVSEHKDAIGFVSFTWLNDPDKSYADLVGKVKIVGVSNESYKEDTKTCFKPSQTTLALKQYPLIRPLYIINSTGRTGLGTGFAAFLASERGQRIILRSGILPDSIPPREVIMGK